MISLGGVSCWPAGMLYASIALYVAQQHALKHARKPCLAQPSSFRSHPRDVLFGVRISCDYGHFIGRKSLSILQYFRSCCYLSQLRWSIPCQPSVRFLPWKTKLERTFSLASSPFSPLRQELVSKWHRYAAWNCRLFGRDMPQF